MNTPETTHTHDMTSLQLYNQVEEIAPGQGRKIVRLFGHWLDSEARRYERELTGRTADEIFESMKWLSSPFHLIADEED